MANRITIPTLQTQITPLRIAEIDVDRNPYRSVVASLADLGKEARLSELRNQPDPFEPREDSKDTPPDATADLEVPPEWGAGNRNPSFDDLLRRQAEENRRQRQRDITDTLNDLADAAYQDPYQIGDYRDEADEILSVVPEAERDAFAPDRARLDESYFRGLIRDNPKLALETLRSRAGAAQEELGISEEMREDLEADALRAFNAEQARLEMERQAGTLHTAVWTKAFELFPDEPHADLWRAYGDIIDVLDRDGRHADWLEPALDKNVRRAQTRARAVTKAAARIVSGDADDWTRPARVEALDSFARSVVGVDAWTVPAGNRMAWVSRAANRVPKMVRDQIRQGVQARDVGKRAFAGRLLMGLDDTLLDWVAPDTRAFGFDFEALAGAGLSDEDAVRRIDAGRALTPVQSDARRHLFHARLSGHALAGALNEALPVLSPGD